jgi:hypothetical protein
MMTQCMHDDETQTRFAWVYECDKVKLHNVLQLAGSTSSGEENSRPDSRCLVNEGTRFPCWKGKALQPMTYLVNWLEHRP